LEKIKSSFDSNGGLPPTVFGILKDASADKNPISLAKVSDYINQLQNITGGLQPEQIDALINFFKKRVNALITKYKFIEKQQFETMIKNKQGSITNQSTKESTVIKNINESKDKLLKEFE